MRKFTFTLIAALVLLCQAAIFAQSPTGTLSGTVQDPQGAVVPGATVTIRNVATGEERKGTTNDSGGFTFDLVNPATYNVTVEAAKFKKAVANEVVVSVGKETAIGISLEIGLQSETVTVSSAQEVVNTTSSIITSVINTRQVADLPLPDRNPLNLAALQAGVAPIGGTGVRGAAISGLRQTGVNLTQDGINAMDNFVKTSSLFAINTPTLNATAEFSVSTSTSGAEAGRGGVQVNMVTKGGANDYHGGVFLQLINDAYAANSFLNNRNRIAKPILRQRYWGFDVSGPVHFLNFGEGKPAHWSGKDKAFFFYSFESFKQAQAVTLNRTVLTQQARAGTFRYNCSATSTDPNCPAGTVKTVNLLTVPGVPFNALNPLMTAHINQIPAPNVFTCGNSDNFNIACFQFNDTQDTTNTKHVVRYDHQVFKDTRLGSHKFEFILSMVETRTFPDITTNNIGAPFPGGVNGFQASKRNLVTPAWVSTFGSNWTNVFRYGRQWAPVDFNRDQQPTAPFISLPGVLTNYDNTFMPQPRNTTVNQFTDTLSWIKGNHLWKFGMDFQQVLGYSINDAGTNQQHNLGTNAANSNGISSGANFPTASSQNITNAGTVYNAIVGMLGSSTQTVNVVDPTSGFVPGATRERTVRGRDLALFAQDQWKMRSNFTLSYGVRWEFMGVPTVPNGLAIQAEYKDFYGISGFGNLFKPTAAPGSQTQAFATLNFVSGDTGKGLYKNDWNNFAPFIGFAYSPAFKSGFLHAIFGDEGTSSFRGSYGTNYLHDGVTTFTNLLGTGVTNPGLIQTSTVSPLSCPTQPCGTFVPNSNIRGQLTATGVPLIFQPFKIPLTDRENFVANNANGLWTADPDLRNAYVHQWNIGFEREIMKDTAIEIRYVGNYAPNLWRAWDINEVNLFENGLLQELVNAERNRVARGGTSFAPANVAGCATCVATPLLDRLFAGLPGNQGYTNTTFLNNLRDTNLGAMAFTLGNNAAYRLNRENPANGIPANFFFANPNAAFARVLDNSGKSWYHAMQLELRRRFSNGLQFQADYTWSKAMLEGDATGNNQSDLAQFLTLRNPSLDHRRSPQDQTQRFVINGLYDLPFGRGKRFFDGANGVVDRIIGGWTIGGIYSWATGNPWYVTSGRSSFNQFTAGNGARLVGITFEEFLNNTGLYKTEKGYFFVNPDLLNVTFSPTTGLATGSTLRPGLMAAPLPGTFGNFPVNSINGPSYWSIDMSLTKRIPITETVRFEFKVTALNLTNTPMFNFGNQNFDSTTFGLITGQNGNPRQVHFIGSVRF